MNRDTVSSCLGVTGSRNVQNAAAVFHITGTSAWRKVFLGLNIRCNMVISCSCVVFYYQLTVSFFKRNSWLPPAWLWAVCCFIISLLIDKTKCVKKLIMSMLTLSERNSGLKRNKEIMSWLHVGTGSLFLVQLLRHTLTQFVLNKPRNKLWGCWVYLTRPGEKIQPELSVLSSWSRISSSWKCFEWLEVFSFHSDLLLLLSCFTWHFK